MNSASIPAPSPFEIPHDDLTGLCASPAFQILRDYLSHQADFCHHHERCSDDAKQTWLLHRDILHALTMPVAQLYKRASALAAAALCSQRVVDLELAFSGEARGAFVWLQCFVTEEEEWVVTSGCPACITAETMSTESHLRFTIAASLLTTASIASPNSSATNSSTSTPLSEDGPTETDSGSSTGLTLPALPHILPALRTALEKDEFWGPDFWPYLFSRSTQLSAGLQALITECVDLESLVSSPADERPTAARSVTMPGVLPSEDAEKGMKIKKSKLAKRQLRLKNEELELMRRSAMQCWARAAIPSKIRNELLGRSPRRRSLTAP
ncbi:hypothetical protein BU24DRAFT_135554 [Aaosphaeria arxii CBS 175.79]|uniref:Uncharacterized protein n=1 Tax=Aaosphaeria arxii CBS 175.79 TaxID=1450172 RepID=A0A6A5Y406_9PLEO|nr:uncharacterized protein BU24DRAFT_135554 [Aaosphaeria arxii CBS 175.79]KAF2020228.1 hypothetical protein BU24DRAFT_135554 [Aaosphaeria arxii CBS 175.79]